MDFEPNHSQVTMRHVGLKVVLLLILAASATAFAQDWARGQLEKSPRHREWVTVNYNGRSIETFVLYPEAKEKRPVVLIIPEIFRADRWGAGTGGRSCRSRQYCSAQRCLGTVEAPARPDAIVGKLLARASTG
jgi:hypothetical protein